MHKVAVTKFKWRKRRGSLQLENRNEFISINMAIAVYPLMSSPLLGEMDGIELLRPTIPISSEVREV